jgi:phosphoribosylaminoimidazole-succinocarboxamide synthase
MPELLHTALFGLPAPRCGKVRDVYDLGNEMLIVATDRISAFDAVMANGIPDKGCLLTQMSEFWFVKLAHICPNHVISIDFEDIQQRCKAPQPELRGRAMLAKKAKVIPIECVARGYISGSLFKEYRAEGGDVHGLDLPDGLVDSDKLPEPIFTPATKADEGHDENISFAAVVNRVGSETAHLLQKWTLDLYQEAAIYAQTKGLILADTKFEFGETEDGIILIDEILTPDSSRYWDAALYSPGKAQPSFDKQFLRDYLETSGWDKNPPGPVLPTQIVEGTQNKYLEAYRLLVGAEPAI